LRIDEPSKSTPESRVCAENGMKVAAIGAISRRGCYIFLSPARRWNGLPGSIGERRKLCGVRQFRFGDAGNRHKLGGLAVAERDRAGLVEQQRVDVAGRLRPRARTWRAR